MIKIEDLKNRHFELIVDKSASMSEADCPGGLTRWQASEELAVGLAQKMSDLGSKGVNITLFSGTKLKIYPDCTGSDVRNIFKENEPFGGTNLALALKNRLDEWFSKGRVKPLTIVTVTDGRPDSEQEVASVITAATKKISADEEIGLLFLQVGKDSKARAYLKRLDDDLEKEGARYDIVSSKTCDEIENSSLTEALLDAVNA